MKRAIIVGLVVVNLALLAGVIGMNTDKAQAQTQRGGNDYLMVTGRIEAAFDAVYLIDLKSRRLAAWRFNRNTKRLQAFKGRQLEADFGR